jgi:hypothetical protein
MISAVSPQGEFCLMLHEMTRRTHVAFHRVQKLPNWSNLSSNNLNVNMRLCDNAF